MSIPVFDVPMDQATRLIVDWGHSNSSAYVCVANVHMAMEARDDPEFGEIVRTADLVVPDGMPLVWMLRLLGHRLAARVRGPDLMLAVLAMAAKEDLPIGLYGGSEEVLERLTARLHELHPDLKIAVSISPPFRQLHQEEETELSTRLRDSGARVIFVGLGCPKQEKWMARHSHELNAPLVGVGAAFDFHAGAMREAPAWQQNLGLEWVYRLFQEPRRLWRRYLYHNPRFVLLALRQLVQARTSES